MICPVAGGGGPARRQTGVSQRGQAGFQRSRPPDLGPPPVPRGAVSSGPGCGRPGRSRGRAPLPVDSGGGDSQRGQGRLSEKSPAGYPPPHHRDAPPGSAGVPPACCPFGCRSVSLRCCSRPPCRREPQGPGRSRGRAPLPVDSGGGDRRGCGRLCAGGTPALPGGLHLMTAVR